jgi:hypothetical protein
MSVCRICHSAAKTLFYAQVELRNNHHSFLAFLKTQVDDSITRSIKKLFISGSDQEIRHWQDFSYIIQCLPNLSVIEFDADNTDWYLEVMTHRIQVEQLQKIKRITISYNSHAGTNQCYFTLVYKLRDTITHLRLVRFLPQQMKGNDLALGLRYLAEFKNLTHLEIQDTSPPEGMEFFTVLEACPKLQHLSMLDATVSLSALLPSTTKLVAYKNLKLLRLHLDQFPEDYVKYITCCVPTTIERLELSIRYCGGNYWMYSGQHIKLIDQFSKHLSLMKNLDFILPRKILEKTRQELEAMLAGTWRFVHKIRGSHRLNMITSAEIKLVSNSAELALSLQYSRFSVRHNKYFNFRVPFFGALNHELCLQSIPVDDMPDLTMIHSLKIHDQKLPMDTDSLLHFLQYMVKRCTRLDRIFGTNTGFSWAHGNLVNLVSTYVIFASTVLTSAQDTSLPPIYVTTPTQENIVYACYSGLMLSHRFLQATCDMFPNLNTVRMDGCHFDQEGIIDLCHLKHLYRLELNLRQVHKKNNVCFIVHMQDTTPMNYYYKRTDSSFELVSIKKMRAVVQHQQRQEEGQNDSISIHIMCYKVDELHVQWSYANELHSDNNNNNNNRSSAGYDDASSSTVYPRLDLLEHLKKNIYMIQ